MHLLSKDGQQIGLFKVGPAKFVMQISELWNNYTTSSIPILLELDELKEINKKLAVFIHFQENPPIISKESETNEV